MDINQTFFTKNTFFIKYEEMFDDNFCLIRNILETLKIPYSNEIFINKEIIKYDNIPSEEKESEEESEDEEVSLHLDEDIDIENLTALQKELYECLMKGGASA
jgi:hypothetical protein